MGSPDSLLSEYYLTEHQLDQLMEHLADAHADSSTLLAFTDKVEFMPEQALIHQGESDAAVYILTEGTLEVFVEVDGKERPVATIEPYALVGDQSFIDGGKRTATVVARTEGVAYRLTDSAFDQVRSVHPEIACAFLYDVSRALAARLRQRARQGS